MAEKILLIQPRWMTGALVQQQVKLWREKSPRAQITLLAAVSFEQQEKNLVQWILPPLQKREMMRFARQLRRERFRHAIVLSDNARGDVGYGEAKFWALAARARRREFNGQPLTLWREARAKRKVAMVFGVHVLVTLCQLLKRPRRAQSVAPANLLYNARTFVYLQHAVHQHGVLPGRVLLIGEGWDQETARRCGWQVAKEQAEKNTIVQLVLADGSCDNKSLLENSGNLVCFSNLEHTVQRPANNWPADWREIENRAAFFDEEARDLWLVAKR